MQTIDIVQDFDKPVSEVFDFLSDHNNLSKLFGAPVKRIVDSKGSQGLNGIGSVRRIGPPVVGIQETVTAFERDQLIEYTITSSGPVRNHLGHMEFSSTARGSRLHYVITLDSSVPGLAPALRVVLGSVIRKGLKRYASKA